MKTGIFLAVSTIAIISGTATATAVLAEQGAAATPPEERQDSSGVKGDAEKVWEDIKSGAAKAYDSAKTSLTDEDKDIEFSASPMEKSKTLTNMIGAPVLDSGGARVATVKDIILDEDGDATMVILASGRISDTDLRTVAFDYDDVVRKGAGGDSVMPMTQEIMDKAVVFSYDREDTAEGVRIMPDTGYSAAALLDADLIDEKNEPIAKVGDIAMEDGHADKLVVVFDQIFGLGGKKAAFSYDDAKLVREGDDVDFQLTSDQSAKFDAYKAQVGQR